MPSPGEELENIAYRIGWLSGPERTVEMLDALTRELDAIDYRMRTSTVPPDERIDLGKISDQARASIERQHHDLLHPNILSPRFPEAPEVSLSDRGWIVDGFDR